MVEYISAEEAHRKTNETLELMYSDSMEEIFNAVYGAIDLGEYLVPIETTGIRWFNEKEYRDRFKKTMKELGYEVSMNGDFSKMVIEW